MKKKAKAKSRPAPAKAASGRAKSGAAAKKSAKARPARKAAPSRPARKAPSSSMSEAARMEAWEKAMTPGAGHQRLAPLVGTWHTKTKFWMAPGGPPMEGAGTSEHRLVLGGRFVEQRYTGTAMGMPFEGIGYTGYDNALGKYVGTWMDGMSTGIMNSVGTGKPTDGELVFASTMFDAATSRTVRFRSIVRIADRNRHSYEMWTNAPGGQEYRTLLVEYTRK